MNNKLLIFMILGFIFLSLFICHAENITDWYLPIDRVIKGMYDKLVRLAQEGKYVQLEVESQNFITVAKQHNRRGIYDDMIHKSYDLRIMAQEKQGRYLEASNTVRDRHAWKPNPQNVEQALSLMQKHFNQSEYFSKLMEFTAFRIEQRKQVLELTKQKEKLVNEYLQKNDLTKEDLEKLQSSIKEINEKIKQINSKIEEERKKHNQEIQKYKDIILRQEQAFEHRTKIHELNKINKDITQTSIKVAQKISQINEKYKWSWNGLEETLKKIKELQDKIIALQKQILEYTKKPLPLSAEDKKKLQELREKLAGLLSEHEKMMADLERAFMDADKFYKLPPDKQIAFFELLKSVRETSQNIAENTKKIDEFINKTLIVYGDLNRDGKIDDRDINIMKDLLTYPITILPYPNPIPPRKYIPAADLDGDGSITEADLVLLKEAVYGERKTFPVDPANIAGDINGNGTIDLKDLNTIVSVVINPNMYPPWVVKVADINKDGKVDYIDISEAVKKINEEKKKKEKKDIASGTVPIATYPSSIPATGPSTLGVTGSGNEASTLRDSF